MALVLWRGHLLGTDRLQGQGKTTCVIFTIFSQFGIGTVSSPFASPPPDPTHAKHAPAVGQQQVRHVSRAIATLALEVTRAVEAVAVATVGLAPVRVRVIRTSQWVPLRGCSCSRISLKRITAMRNF